MLRKLIAFSLVLTLVVAVFGAYVRLADAGLGCPDWPGCYGELSPHHAADDIRAAHAADPLGPVSMPKAWKEMIHRYLASALGVLILGIAFLSWRRARARNLGTPWLAYMLVGVVIFQGLLGKWTVTLLLKPAIVSLHLMGGLTVLGMLAWLYLRELRPSRYAAGRMALAARIGMLLLLVQIGLGGWVSTNYAAVICTDLLTCHGQWWPDMDFGNAFHVVRELGMTAQGDLLSKEALTAIHMSHRLGAVLIGAYLLVFAFRLARSPQMRGLALGLATALIAQILIGIGNVIFSLPLALAVAHNAGALLLALLLIVINYSLRPVRAGERMERIWHESFAD